MRIVNVSIVQIVILFENLRNLILDALTKLLWRKNDLLNIKRILIYRVGNIGDVVVAIPSIMLIKKAYPEAEIIFLSSPGNRGAPGAKQVFEKLEIFSEIIEYYLDDKVSLYQLAKNHKSLQNIDLIIDLPSQFETFRSCLKRMVFMKYLNSKGAFGWEISTSKVFRRIQNSYRDFPYEKDRLTKLVATQLKLDELEVKFDLTKYNPKRDQDFKDSNYIVLAPGAKRSTNKWNLENFKDIASYLTLRNFTCILIGGKDDSNFAEKIKGKNSKILNLCGKVSIFDSLCILDQASLSICLDSGVQHMSSMVGTPTISIFSSRDFSGKWFPNNQDDVVLRSSTNCEVCLCEICPYDNKCINSISPEAVKKVLYDRFRI